MLRAAAVGAALFLGGCQVLFEPAPAEAIDPCPGRQGAQIFEDFEGAEAWDTWETQGGELRRTSDESHCGGAVRASDDGGGGGQAGAVFLLPEDATEVTIRAQVYLAEGVPGDEVIQFLSAGTTIGTGEPPELAVGVTPGGLIEVFIVEGNESLTPGAQLESRRWYDLELRATVAGADSRIELLVGGEVALPEQSVDLGSTPLAWALLGIHWSLMDAPAEIRVDNVAIFAP